MKRVVQGHRTMAGFMMFFSLLFLFTVAAAVAAVHADQNPPAFFVFGDSLSDVGNNNDLPDAPHANHPHYGVDFPGGVATGRFTNGYNFIDIIANQTGLGQSPPAYASVLSDEISKGVNFASGGSGILVACMKGTNKTCITMREQLDNFKSVWEMLQQTLGPEATAELMSKSIFVFTCGGNDLNDFFTDNIANPIGALLKIDCFVEKMASTFRDQLKELYNRGARKFFVINVPALGMIPTAQVLNFVGIPVILNDFARKFNDAEYTMLEKLSSTLPGMKFSVGNAYAAILEVTQHAEKFGLKNVSRPCCGAVRFVPAIPPVEIIQCTPDSWLCPNRGEFAFWDFIHPTLRVIEYAGKQFYGGDTKYSSPINLKQLVYSEITSRGFARILGRRGAEAM